MMSFNVKKNRTRSFDNHSGTINFNYFTNPTSPTQHVQQSIEQQHALEAMHESVRNLFEHSGRRGAHHRR